MIHRITASNYYSINNRITVDFVLDGKAPSDDSHKKSDAGVKVSLVNMIVGPNASGKTNVLKVLPFIRHLISFSYRSDPDADLPFKPFGDPIIESPEPTELEVEFSIDQRIFIYNITLNRTMITQEVLKEKRLVSVRYSTKTLFKRTWNEKQGAYDISASVFSLDNADYRQNASVLGAAWRKGDELATLISTFWRDAVFSNIFELGYRGDHPASRQLMPKHAVEFFFSKPEIMHSIKELLNKYDIGFSEFVEHEFGDEKEYGIKHKFGKLSFEIPLDYESSGTKQLLVVLRHALAALSVPNGIAIIDELDANLHPVIVEEIISLFSSNETNINSSQILFSSHSHLVMNNLTKYQIFLTAKNKEGCTDLWRLADVSGVRSIENYAARYITGAYGGVPDIG